VVIGGHDVVRPPGTGWCCAEGALHGRTRVYPYDMGNCRVPARPGEVRRLGRDPRRTPEGPGSVPGAPSTEHPLSVRDLLIAVQGHFDEMALGALHAIRRAAQDAARPWSGVSWRSPGARGA